MLRDNLKIISCKKDITYAGDGKANHFFLLMVFGMKSNEAYELAYKK